MITTVISFGCSIVGLSVGLYTFIRHLNALSKHKTQAADAWLVSVGSLAWLIMSYAMLHGIIEHRTLDPYELGIGRVETLSSVLFLIYWIGMLLQVQKHCLKIKLRKRKLERHEYNKINTR